MSLRVLQKNRSKMKNYKNYLVNLIGSSVSDPYSLNPDPDPAKNLNPDPGKFFSPTKKFD